MFLVCCCVFFFLRSQCQHAVEIRQSLFRLRDSAVDWTSSQKAMRIHGLSSDKQAQASLPAATKAAFHGRREPGGAFPAPTRLADSGIRREKGREEPVASLGWRRKERRLQEKRKKRGRDASYRDGGFPPCPPKGFFGGNAHGSEENEANRWILPQKCPARFSRTRHPTPIAACCKLRQKPRSREIHSHITPSTCPHGLQPSNS